MKLPTFVTVIALSVTPIVLHAADENSDNTEKNERDQSGETLTPIDQSNDSADLTITAETRKMLMADDTLSSNARNCKVITTTGGAVTLRGPVDSAEEKAVVARHAKAAGATTVTNQLEVKTSN